jgi:hypothetical protein
VRRHFGLPWIILCALGGLALGGVALGLLQAPASADLAVHNAVGETLAAPTFVAVSSSSQTRAVTRLDFRAPAHLVLTSSATTGPKKLVLNGTAATRVLQPISALSTVNGFTNQRGLYTAPLVNPALTREGASAGVALTVKNGYLTSVLEKITINSSQGNGTLTGSVRFLRIGNWTLPSG